MRRNGPEMKLRQVAGIFSKRWREPAVCEACGGGFDCGASLKGCWCSAVKLSDETRAELRAQYRYCLCRGCIEKFAVGKTQRTEEA